MLNLTNMNRKNRTGRLEVKCGCFSSECTSLMGAGGIFPALRGDTLLAAHRGFTRIREVCVVAKQTCKVT